MASSAPVHVLVLEHVDGGHPWFLRTLLQERGVRWSTVRPDAGDPLPDPASCDALWVMGGAMQVWQEEKHPWLAPEKRFIRGVVEAGRPYLGVCLGHQLLAAALGGEVAQARTAEIGMFSVVPTEDGPAAGWWAGREAGTRLQWHQAEVVTPPPDATVLARSERCEVQALAVGECALSLQYHVEADVEMLPTWCESESARATLAGVFGGDGPAEFQAQALRALPGLQGHARRVLDDWLARAKNSA